MPINGHGQNMMSGGTNGLLSVCVNNATSGNNSAKVIKYYYFSEFLLTELRTKRTILNDFPFIYLFIFCFPLDK